MTQGGRIRVGENSRLKRFMPPEHVEWRRNDAHCMCGRDAQCAKTRMPSIRSGFIPVTPIDQDAADYLSALSDTAYAVR